ncbi:MAG: hypothetical protein WCP33_08425 [Deltaproteobacteria bacterium]
MIATIELTEDEERSVQPVPDKSAGVAAPLTLHCPVCKDPVSPGARCIRCNKMGISATEQAKPSNCNGHPAGERVHPSQEKHQEPDIIPYQTGGHKFSSLHDIAIYFTTNWDEGMKQINENYILKWAKSIFPHGIDVDSIEFLKELSRKQKIADDIRLMQFIARFCLELPPIWKSIPLTRENIIALLEKANDGNATARATAFELMKREILAAVLDVRKDNDIEWCWNATLTANESCKNAAQRQLDVGGPYDELPDDQSITGPAIMLAAISDEHRERLRSSVKKVAGNAEKNCPWFAVHGAISAADPGTLVLMSMVAPLAAKQSTRKSIFG